MPFSNGETELRNARMQLSKIIGSTKIELIASFHRSDEKQRYEPSRILEEFNFSTSDSSQWILKENPKQRPSIDFETIFNESLAIGESEKISGGSELLSDQSRCPFKSFAINRLGAIPDPEPTIGISKMTKGTALHIALEFLFTEIPVEAKIVRDKLLSISAVLGYGGAEVFPKQIELKSQDDTGNFLNLPYFNCANTTRYAFLESGEAATLESFFELVERHKQQDISTIEIKRPETPYSDGPPCIELMAQNKISEGGRNNALFHYGVYAKSKWPQNWKSKITLFNESAMAQPLSDTEVNIIVKQHEKKDWGYKLSLIHI